MTDTTVPPADQAPTTRPNRHGSATVTLPSDLEILITRVFDAPADMIFRAWTTPELVRRWWGYETSPLVVCDIDLRVGGSWRYVTRDQDGTELGWHGTYTAIEAPRTLVSTEVFEGYPDGEAINTMVLDERDGTTTMSVTVLHQSRANRDGHVDSGMEHGLQNSLNRIEDLLETVDATESVEASPGPDGSANSGTIADRYRTVGGRFTDTVRSVPAEAWDNDAPCEGWVARDVVRHLVDWVPGLLQVGAGIEMPHGPSVDQDPVGAWTTLHDSLQALLDDPATTGRTFSHPQAGTHALDQAIGMFIMGDVLIHTWDIARATGLDETLDPTEVAGMYAGMLPLDEMLRMSGQFGPRVEVPSDADVQTRLIAFTGRRP